MGKPIKSQKLFKCGAIFKCSSAEFHDKEFCNRYPHKIFGSHSTIMWVCIYTNETGLRGDVHKQVIESCKDLKKRQPSLREIHTFCCNATAPQAQIAIVARFLVTGQLTHAKLPADIEFTRVV